MCSRTSICVVADALCLALARIVASPSYSTLTNIFSDSFFFCFTLFLSHVSRFSLSSHSQPTFFSGGHPPGLHHPHCRPPPAAHVFSGRAGEHTYQHTYARAHAHIGPNTYAHVEPEHGAGVLLFLLPFHAVWVPVLPGGHVEGEPAEHAQCAGVLLELLLRLLRAVFYRQPAPEAVGIMKRHVVWHKLKFYTKRMQVHNK